MLNQADSRMDQSKETFGWPGDRTTVGEMRSLRSRAIRWMLVAGVVLWAVALVTAVL